MAKRKTLKDIKKLYRRRKYAEVVRLLEAEVFRFRDSFLYYRLLGLSCLCLGDGGGAFTYLNRARQIKDDDVDTLLGLAAAHLKKRDLDEALRLWLRVLELDPGNRTARRGLEQVRKGMSEEALSLLVDSGAIRRFYPPRPLRISPALGLVFMLAAVLAGGAYLFLTRGSEILSALRPNATTAPPVRPEIEAIALSRDALRTDLNARARYELTETEVDVIWKKAKELFTAFRDNPAVVELNRLLNSNASAYVRESCRRLKRFARTPGFKDFAAFTDNYALAAVSGAPWLYDGCYVLWRGTIAGLKVGQEEIRFQFLVGSYDKREFEGAVEVVFDFAEVLENNFYVELLGRVVQAGEGFHLEGVLHRRLHPDGPGFSGR